MGSLSIWHWGIVLLVVVLVFGTKKLANLGGDLGSAVKGFKEGIRSDNEPERLTEQDGQPVTEGEVRSKTLDDA